MQISAFGDVEIRLDSDTPTISGFIAWLSLETRLDKVFWETRFLVAFFDHGVKGFHTGRNTSSHSLASAPTHAFNTYIIKHTWVSTISLVRVKACVLTSVS